MRGRRSGVLVALLVSVYAFLCAPVLSQADNAADPGEAGTAVSRGDAKMEQHDVDGAIADYTQAIAADARDVDALFGRGVAWTIQESAAYDAGSKSGAQQAAARAIEDFAQAIALDPQRPGAYVGRGMMLLATGRATAAGKDFERALALDAGVKPLIERRSAEIRRRKILH